MVSGPPLDNSSSRKVPLLPTHDLFFVQILNVNFDFLNSLHLQPDIELKQAIQTDSFAAKDAEILCQVEEVVQQSLSCHSTKMLKAIKHNDHCALTMKAFL